MMTMLCISLAVASAAAHEAALDYEIKLTIPREEFDGSFCWFHPRVAAIPGAGKDGQPRALMTLQKHLLPADDYYSGLFVMCSDDLGATWTNPERLCVLRATEREILPNRGATLGNFGVCNVSENETWVTDAEGMFFPEVYKKHGAKGAVFAARILRSRPNHP